MAVPRSGCATMRTAGAARDQEEGADDPPVGCALVEPAGDQIGREDRQRQLHQLRRLEPELAETDPPARALHVDPEPGHQDHEEEEERDPEQERASRRSLRWSKRIATRERDDAHRPSTWHSRMRMAHGLP